MGTGTYARELPCVLPLTLSLIAVVALPFFLDNIPIGCSALALSPPTPSPKHHHESFSSPASKLRQLITNAHEQRSTIALPGVHDALSAKIFSDAGAQALFLSGFGVSATKQGEPDAGLLTQSQMENAAQSTISASYPTPVLVDGDTGYGGASNLRKTISNLARLGAAAVTIEDQVFPKRCTYAAGRHVKVISRRDCRARMVAALAAREEVWEKEGREILVVARTDCRMADGYGFGEVLERCRLLEGLGADVVYAENLQSREEYVRLRESLGEETIMMLAQVQMGGTGSRSLEGLFTTEEVGEMGYALALFGVTALQATVEALKRTAEVFLDDTSGGLVRDSSMVDLASFSDVKDVVGFSELDEWESKYGFDG